MRVYLSGPMTDLPQHNYPAFAHACMRLRNKGYEVVSPHEIKHLDKGIPGSIPWGDYLRRDIVDLMTCDGIVVLPGWERSRGATLEVYIATQVGMSVQTIAEVADYVQHSSDF